MFFELDSSSTSVAAPTTSTMPKNQTLIARQIFIHPTPSLPSPSSFSSLDKGRPLLQRHVRSNSTNSCHSGRFAELAGGTTAECAAICCCCPCVLVNLLYLTICKVPAGLCRRALRRKRRNQLIKQGLLPARTNRRHCGFDDTDILIHQSPSMHELVEFRSDSEASDEEEEMMKLEKEMWETFYNTGFWRSPSQKEGPGMRSNLHIDSLMAKVKQL
ncbi:hypothetical protein P3X46_004314 [Hevea brasiliensis]|uniref:Uncharacterized protein n=1 Tax=Hevea brasiliensis TaxID=3981 RepID=A0ABQ9MYU3_HEVBR|nr:uncharacterized protein LOC110647968 [Hevea brasiliensis]KAJ9184602.1 hypothetical protein P3X46_004314 [Hevea brasiliensis]